MARSYDLKSWKHVQHVQRMARQGGLASMNSSGMV